MWSCVGWFCVLAKRAATMLGLSVSGAPIWLQHLSCNMVDTTPLEPYHKKPFFEDLSFSALYWSRLMLSTCLF